MHTATSTFSITSFDAGRRPLANITNLPKRSVGGTTFPVPLATRPMILRTVDIPANSPPPPSINESMSSSPSVTGTLSGYYLTKLPDNHEDADDDDLPLSRVKELLEAAHRSAAAPITFDLSIDNSFDCEDNFPLSVIEERLAAAHRSAAAPIISSRSIDSSYDSDDSQDDIPLSVIKERWESSRPPLQVSTILAPDITSLPPSDLSRIRLGSTSSVVQRVKAMFKKLRIGQPPSATTKKDSKLVLGPGVKAMERGGYGRIASL